MFDLRPASAASPGGRPAACRPPWPCWYRYCNPHGGDPLVLGQSGVCGARYYTIIGVAPKRIRVSRCARSPVHSAHAGAFDDAGDRLSPTTDSPGSDPAPAAARAARRQRRSHAGVSAEPGSSPAARPGDPVRSYPPLASRTGARAARSGPPRGEARVAVWLRGCGGGAVDCLRQRRQSAPGAGTAPQAEIAVRLALAWHGVIAPPAAY
jgi:hypothetical protein